MALVDIIEVTLDKNFRLRRGKNPTEVLWRQRESGMLDDSRGELSGHGRREGGSRGHEGVAHVTKDGVRFMFFRVKVGDIDFAADVFCYEVRS